MLMMTITEIQLIFKIFVGLRSVSCALYINIIYNVFLHYEYGEKRNITLYTFYAK